MRDISRCDDFKVKNKEEFPILDFSIKIAMKLEPQAFYVKRFVKHKHLVLLDPPVPI